MKTVIATAILALGLLSTAIPAQADSYERGLGPGARSRPSPTDEQPLGAASTARRTGGPAPSFHPPDAKRHYVCLLLVLIQPLRVDLIGLAPARTTSRPREVAASAAWAICGRHKLDSLRGGA